MSFSNGSGNPYRSKPATARWRISARVATTRPVIPSGRSADSQRTRSGGCPGWAMPWSELLRPSLRNSTFGKWYSWTVSPARRSTCAGGRRPSSGRPWPLAGSTIRCVGSRRSYSKARRKVYGRRWYHQLGPNVSINRRSQAGSGRSSSSWRSDTGAFPGWPIKVYCKAARRPPAGDFDATGGRWMRAVIGGNVSLTNVS